MQVQVAWLVPVYAALHAGSLLARAPFILQKDLHQSKPGVAGFEEMHPWLRQSHEHLLHTAYC